MDVDYPALYCRLKGLETLPADSSEVLDWSGLVVKDENKCLGCGAFGDVFVAKWTDAAQKVTKDLPDLAIKVLRATDSNETLRQKRIKSVWREAYVAQGLDHPNVLKFCGLVQGVALSQFPCLLTPYMPNGTIREHLARSTACDRTLLILGITRGLEYLHSRSPPIIHGDLKADNILIDHQGNPVLTDFGLSRMAEELTLFYTSATAAGGSLRWMAPELVSREARIGTTETDIWAYGMTVFEVMTGTLPYSHLPHEGAVISSILQRQLPQIQLMIAPASPEWATSLVRHTWKFKPKRRPPATVLTKAIEFAIANPTINDEKGFLDRELIVACLTKSAMDVAVVLALGAEINMPLNVDDIERISFSGDNNNDGLLAHLKVGYRPLHVACSAGRPDIARLLILLGGSIHVSDRPRLSGAHSWIHVNTDAEWTPLQAACYKGHLDIVMLLVSFGADVNTRTQRHGTPLEIAQRQGHIHITAFLLERGALQFLWPYEIQLLIRIWNRGIRWRMIIAGVVLAFIGAGLAFYFAGKRLLPRHNAVLSSLAAVMLADFVPDIVVYNWKRMLVLTKILCVVLTGGLGAGMFYAHWEGPAVVAIPITGLAVWRVITRVSHLFIVFSWYDTFRMLFYFLVTFVYAYGLHIWTWYAI